MHYPIHGRYPEPASYDRWLCEGAGGPDDDNGADDPAPEPEDDEDDWDEYDTPLVPPGPPELCPPDDFPY